MALPLLPGLAFDRKVSIFLSIILKLMVKVGEWETLGKYTCQMKKLRQVFAN